MGFGLVDRAIALRLLGKGPETEIVSLDGFKASAGGNPAPNKPIKIGDRLLSAGSLKRVPIFRFSPQGQPFNELYPAIVYNFVGIQFNPERFIPGVDGFREPVLESMTYSEDGRIGPRFVRERPHPMPYDLTYSITVMDRDDTVSAMLMQTVLEEFPARDYLTYLQADGSSKSTFMYLAGVVNQDDPEPTVDRNSQRTYAWMMTYIIETHLDNTAVSELKKTNLGTEIEVVKKET